MKFAKMPEDTGLVLSEDGLTRDEASASEEEEEICSESESDSEEEREKRLKELAEQVSRNFKFHILIMRS